MSLRITISNTDEATPVLNGLLRELKDRTGLHKYIGATAEGQTRQYLREIAKTTHKTANKLKARPTGYLTKRAELVQGGGDANQATITVTGAIFKRAFGPVTVRATAGKMLTIPMRAEAYGKRAGEFNDLFIFRSRQGRLFLARQAEPGKLHFLFLLKAVVTLPQDRELLPDDEAFTEWAEIAARAYLRKQMRDLGPKTQP